MFLQKDCAGLQPVTPDNFYALPVLPETRVPFSGAIEHSFPGMHLTESLWSPAGGPEPCHFIEPASPATKLALPWLEGGGLKLHFGFDCCCSVPSLDPFVGIGKTGGLGELTAGLGVRLLPAVFAAFVPSYVLKFLSQ